MSTTPNLALALLSVGQSSKEITVNNALYELDIMVPGTIIDKDLTAPPGSPTDGDAYIVSATATGDWAGEETNIAYWVTAVGVWQFITPAEGWKMYVVDEALVYRLLSSAWVAQDHMLTDMSNYDGTAIATFLSTGIDDNATGIMHTIADGQTSFGDAAGTGAYDLLRRSNVAQMVLSGGNAVNAGANIILNGGATAGTADDFQFRASATPVLEYNDSASLFAFTGAVDINGDLSFANTNPQILGDDTDGVFYISAGASNALGANLSLYGDTQAGSANDFRFRADADNVLYYDHSATEFAFTGSATFSGNVSSDVFHADADANSKLNFATTNQIGLHAGGTRGVTVKSDEVELHHEAVLATMVLGGALNNPEGLTYKASIRGLLVAGDSGTDGVKVYLHRDDVTITAGNTIGEIVFTGADGVDNIGAQIGVEATGTWSASSSPSKMKLMTTPGGGTTSLTGLTVNSNQTVEVAAGVYIGGTAAANLLDDYEEGTFVPVLEDGSANVVTALTQVGRYTKIGNRCTLNGYYKASSLASATGTLYFTALPFTSVNVASSYGFIAVPWATGLAITAGQNMGMYIATNAAYANTAIWNSSGGSSVFTAAKLSDDGGFNFGGSYETV